MRRGILVRYFNKPGLSDCIRFSIGTPEQNDVLLAALEECSARQRGLSGARIRLTIRTTNEHAFVPSSFLVSVLGSSKENEVASESLRDLRDFAPTWPGRPAS